MGQSELLNRHRAVMPSWLTLYYESPIELVSGQGCRVTDLNGRSYVDCTSQAWTLALGYNHPEVIEAAVSQMRTLAHVRAGFPTIPRLLLAKKLADLSGLYPRRSYSLVLMFINTVTYSGFQS